MLLDFSIHLFPETFMSTVKLFHKEIKMHDILSFNTDKVLINFIKCN